jgi:hypothetical protein
MSDTGPLVLAAASFDRESRLPEPVSNRPPGASYPRDDPYLSGLQPQQCLSQQQ